MQDEQLNTEEIGVLVKKFVHRLEDVDAAIKMFVPKAIDEYNARIEKAQDLYKKFLDFRNAHPEQFPDFVDDLDKDLEDKINDEQCSKVACDIQEHEALIAMNQAARIYTAVDNSDIVSTLSQALFLNLFSILDAFTGELLETLYTLKPDLYRTLNKTVSFDVIMTADNIDVIKKKILNDEIESFRRESYVDQFKSLENRFGLKTLTNFSYWKAFVEYTQKRNVLMHCDGIVSEQYIQVCKKVGIKDKQLPKVGERLELESVDVLVASHIIGQTGIMLAYTLWNKLFPGDRENLDENLHNLCFDFLLEESWFHASGVGEFIENSLPPTDAATSKMNTINLGIAYKATNKDDRLNETLSKVDWSLLSLDFRLAESVLLDQFDKAAMYMKKIGPEGDYIRRGSYHEWPLFREFRNSQEFLNAYKLVYQEAFISNQAIEMNEKVKKLDPTEDALEL